tara:strand:- start:1881 stop:2396 length:516 start_codon:yes stop_codon:yes gene_type:complete
MSSYDKVYDVKDFDIQGGIFTNGCFDIIHKGHIGLFQFCDTYRAQKGFTLNNWHSKIIVGVNSDLSIKKLKGDNRPIMDQDNRLSILNAISFIDYIVLFDTESVFPLIQKIKPKVLVKGGNYNVKPCAVQEQIVGQEFVESYGGKVITAPMVEGVSTSNIVDKISRNNNVI